MDRYFNVALHGFEGMRRSGPAWRYSIRFSQLAHQTSDFLVIHSISYKQTVIKTGRKRNFIDSLPISSRFYEYLFRDYCDYRMGNLSIG